MEKTILLTGATDGIGLETAKLLAGKGHNLLLHGRNPAKLEKVKAELSAKAEVESYRADLANLDEVKALASAVAEKHEKVDVLINNAGVFMMTEKYAADGQDLRFVVNTIAPYLLTRLLLPIIPADGRIVNLSSAAQSPVSIDALKGKIQIADDFQAYAQSKLALTMWTTAMANEFGENGPIAVSVNPGSMLNTNMVKDAFGATNNDVSIGANILVRAALSDEFAESSGKYFDNDSGRFAPPHPFGSDSNNIKDLVDAIDSMLA